MTSVFTSKYFEILKTFSESELKSFDSWLNSPWCNSNKNLITLLDKIKKYYPDFDNDKLTKEKLFKQVLPKGKYSDRRMNNLLSEGYQAAEKFIIFQKLSQDSKLQKDLLSQEFQSRHLEDWFFRDINKEIGRLEEKEVKDWEDHLSLLHLNRRTYHHPNQNPRRRPGGETIVKMGEELDFVYLLEKATIINEKITRNRLLKNENHNYEKELAVWLDISSDKVNTSLDLYKMRFKYNDENMHQLFIDLKNVFFKNYEKLNIKEQRIQFLSLMNDSSFLRRRGKINLNDVYSLLKFGIETNLLLENNKLTRVSYTSVITTGNILNDFEFTKYLIENYTQYLKPDIQADARQWAISHTKSKQKDFDACLSILLSHKFKSHDFQILIRTLTLQTYFEIFLQRSDSYETFLFSYCDSYERWLNREYKKSGYIRNALILFIQRCRGLAKIYIQPHFSEEKLHSLFVENRGIQSIEWLLEKKEQMLSLKGKK